MENDLLDSAFENLKVAKKNVIWLIEDGHGDASVNMHGLLYWASEVERLREIIKKEL